MRSLSISSIISLHCSPPRRHLHSFPTRRSSDLERCVRAANLLCMKRQDKGHQRFAAEVKDLSRRGTSKETENHRTDRKSTRLNSSHRTISYAVFCLKKKKTNKLAIDYEQLTDVI